MPYASYLYTIYTTICPYTTIIKYILALPIYLSYIILYTLKKYNEYYIIPAPPIKRRKTEEEVGWCRAGAFNNNDGLRAGVD
jgi:hypothetical protein